MSQHLIIFELLINYLKTSSVDLFPSVLGILLYFLLFQKTEILKLLIVREELL